jgi:hypothetical protein
LRLKLEMCFDELNSGFIFMFILLTSILCNHRLLLAGVVCSSAVFTR